MNPIKELIQHSAAIEERLGYRFNDRSLLILSFIHRSFINENKDVKEHNERLEFLGDSVLGLLMADYLYRTFPTRPEGQLSYLRSRLVEASSCVGYIQSLDIEQYLLLGRGEKMNDGRGRESILADLLEAIIGAIYLDGGIDAARQFLFTNFAHKIESILKTPLQNWKALLQDHCQKKFQQTPFYKVLRESGPDHGKSFEISVLVNDMEVGRGTGASKKEAQQAAAADAVSRLDPSQLFSGTQHEG
jgi:ribonuclease-3